MLHFFNCSILLLMVNEALHRYIVSELFGLLYITDRPGNPGEIEEKQFVSCGLTWNVQHKHSISRCITKVLHCTAELSSMIAVIQACILSVRIPLVSLDLQLWFYYWDSSPFYDPGLSKMAFNFLEHIHLNLSWTQTH